MGSIPTVGGTWLKSSLEKRKNTAGGRRGQTGSHISAWLWLVGASCWSFICPLQHGDNSKPRKWVGAFCRIKRWGGHHIPIGCQAHNGDIKMQVLGHQDGLVG